MQVSTKKCLLTYAGAIMFAFGFGIMLDGINYSVLGLANGGHPAARAVSHWCGILLILLGARNFTLGLAQWKHGVNCCGEGTFEVLLVNFLALLVSLASAGLPIYGSWDWLENTNAERFAQNPDFIYLISIWFMSLMCAILALLSLFAACCSTGTPSEEDEVEMQQFGHDNPQYNKY